MGASVEKWAGSNTLKSGILANCIWAILWALGSLLYGQMTGQAIAAFLAGCVGSSLVLWMVKRHFAALLKSAQEDLTDSQAEVEHMTQTLSGVSKTLADAQNDVKRLTQATSAAEARMAQALGDNEVLATAVLGLVEAFRIDVTTDGALLVDARGLPIFLDAPRKDSLLRSVSAIKQGCPKLWEQWVRERGILLE
jgi:uncharacterized membrane protein YeaQ/YmgE (transglycosylase-associated protein family)